jgi:hypothetical protein
MRTAVHRHTFVALGIEERPNDNLDPVVLEFSKLVDPGWIGENSKTVEARFLFLKFLHKRSTESTSSADNEHRGRHSDSSRTWSTSSLYSGRR